MLVVEKEGQVSQYLEKVSLDTGMVRIDFDSFELANVQKDEIYFVEGSSLVKQKLATRLKFDSCVGVIVFGEYNESLACELSNIINFVDESTPVPLVRNQLQILRDLSLNMAMMRSQLLIINKDLKETMGSLESNLSKVKEVYEKRTAKRFDQIKGMSFLSKYCAGDNSGGEFFDMFEKNGRVFVMMSSTSSYIASSSILTFFSQLKSGHSIDQKVEESFILEVKNEIKKINKNKKKPIEISLFTAIIDLNTFEVCGHSFGKFRTLSSFHQNSYAGNDLDLLSDSIEDSQFERNIQRGERLLLTSPGLNLNWQKMAPSLMMEELLINKKMKSLDILDEIFFQLKQSSDSGFLESDASVIMLEVDNNVILQV